MSNFSDFIGSSGGGGTEINGLVGGLTGKSMYTTASGEVYLLTGQTLTDVASYPDAQLNIGITKDPTTVALSNPWYGSASDGVLGFGMTTSKVIVISTVTDATGAWAWSANIALGAEYNTVTSTTLQYALDMTVVDNGSSKDLYVLGYGVTASNGKVIKHAGVTSTSLGSVSTITLPSIITTPRGITWDGTYFWVFDATTKAVHKLTSSFVATGESHYIGYSFCKLEYDSGASTVWAFFASNTNMEVGGLALSTGSRMWPNEMNLNQPLKGMVYHATTNTMGLIKGSGNVIHPVDMTEKTVGHPFPVSDTSTAKSPKYENWITYFKRIK
tara:strand:- start:217 stop:1203 length:987 start_codon:yes stop_codon:yes gene_type:complete